MVDLDVYLDRELVGRLVGGPDPTSVAFRYADRWLSDGIAIAHGLPLQATVASPEATRAFFDGLLPEATIRTELGRIWRKDPLDTYGLLAAIGRESAGAISVLEHATEPAFGAQVDWLDETALAEALAALPTAPLASVPATEVRVSLGGAQDKLVLVRGTTGWGLPHAGTPSTHIAKPDPQRDLLRHLALNEFVCCRWGTEAGLPVAPVELLDVRGRRVLVSTRFDRKGDHPGVQRLHQEDFAQITGRLSLAKYEQDGGPSLAECLAALTTVSADPVTDRRRFLDAVWGNALLGNADAHAKNYAMLLDGRSWRLSPMYDVLCTLVYDEVDHGLAMRLDGATGGRAADPDYLSPDALAAGLASWGYVTAPAQRSVARRLVELADRVLAVRPAELTAGLELARDEKRHVTLMQREIHRRASNLRSTATGLA